MSEPIPDDPPPDVQDAVDAGAGFAPAPGGASLCGFALPNLKIFLKFKLPPIPFPLPFPPNFTLAFQFNCDLSNPLSVSGGPVPPPGGGRVAKPPKDPDDDHDY